MAFPDFAHLVRYAFSLLIFPASVWLLVGSLRDFYRRFRRANEPVRGFFLLASDPLNPDEIRTLPLFHTTQLGASRFCDIRVRSRGVEKRHATIYFYDGVWYLEPLPESLVFHNYKEISGRTRLAHGDHIGMGSALFSFVIDASDLHEADEDESSYYLADRTSSGRSLFVTLSLLLFQALGLAVLGLGMRGTVTEGLMGLVLVSLGFVFTALHLSYYLMSRLVPGFDEGLWHAIAMLASIGIILQSRLWFLSRVFPSWIDGYTYEDWYASLRTAFFGQAGALFIGIVLFPLIMTLVRRTGFLEGLAPACFVLTPLLYGLTLVLGRGDATHGAGLWIRLPGGLSLQLTEFAKITWLIVLAYFFRHRPRGRILIVFGGWALVNSACILLLPDLGSLMVLFPATLIVFTVMTSNYAVTLLTTGLAVIGGTLAYRALPYVQRRLYGWISLWEGINDDNRQIIYGLQAVSRGGLFGRGLGNGSPEGIPLASSDMIFSIVWEEFGLLIAVAVILMFVVIWLRSAGAMSVARDGFTTALTLAIATSMVLEAFIVIGGTTGLIPLTGVTLPFIARGGSSMLAKWMMAAILMGLVSRSRTMKLRRSGRKRHEREEVDK